jgi:molecular chaperone GrpE
LPDDKKQKREVEDELTEPEEVLEGKDHGLEQMEKQLKLLETEADQLKKSLDEEKKGGEGYLNRIKYLQADFENYRKRMDREMKEVEDFSTTKLVRKLLPILDELELGITSAESAKDTKSIVEGIKMVLKNLTSILEGEGLHRVEAVGKPFNPELHEAVDKVEGKKSRDDIVIEEIRRGFIFKDRVLRPSMVKVEIAARSHNKANDEVKEIGEHEQ